MVDDAGIYNYFTPRKESQAPGKTHLVSYSGLTIGRGVRDLIDDKDNGCSFWAYHTIPRLFAHDPRYSSITHP